MPGGMDGCGGRAPPPMRKSFLFSHAHPFPDVLYPEEATPQWRQGLWAMKLPS
ncbi:hypothetical protein DESPIG_01786 [Desulfovibrio piger ATCC 29098]|uniref:Uncharacterized protein n=1 Tax=Desulfovibrio piger ATCC 29098 TaxID=411464 RepID=B6WUM5_9BACT|nr:hypothetical protein DESPIG_01786 [Desulfovibrio piger ATCC 29098]